MPFRIRRAIKIAGIAITINTIVFEHQKVHIKSV